MKKSVRNSFLTTAVLFAVLAGLAGYYFTVFVPGSKKKNDAPMGLLLENFRKNDIRSMDIDWENQTNRFHVSLENREGAWAMISPYREDADAETVNTAINTLSSLEISRIFTNSSPGEYGNGKPELSVIVRYTDGARMEIVDKGRSSDGKYRYFTLSDKTNLVFLVPGDEKELPADPDDYREKNIFNIPLNELTAVEVLSGGKTFRFAVAGGEHSTYTMLEPEKKPVDGAEFRSKLVDLYSLTVSGFLGKADLSKGLAVYGLDKPAFTVRLFSKTRSNELLIGKSSGAGYYIRMPQKNVLALTGDTEIAEKLDMSVFTGVKK